MSHSPSSHGETHAQTAEPESVPIAWNQALAGWCVALALAAAVWLLHRLIQHC